MIIREEYLNALEIIDKYHHQFILTEVVSDSPSRKTPINEWEHINKCSTRLRHLLYHKPICLDYNGNESIDGWVYIENVSRQGFLMQRNAGKNSWKEFVELRGY